MPRDADVPHSDAPHCRSTATTRGKVVSAVVSDRRGASTRRGFRTCVRAHEAARMPSALPLGVIAAASSPSAIRGHEQPSRSRPHRPLQAVRDTSALTPVHQAAGLRTPESALRANRGLAHQGVASLNGRSLSACVGSAPCRALRTSLPAEAAVRFGAAQIAAPAELRAPDH